jgi:glycosyltransferase involved in cell wall biosynthesis
LIYDRPGCAMFDKKIIIVTPWFERFAGGAELLARGMARELNKRGITTIVFTTCSRSPYDSWWEDHYRPGVYDVAGIETRRFATVKDRARYDGVIRKLSRGANLKTRDEHDFFDYGINSSDLVDALGEYVDGNYEIIALPYFHGLTNSVVNKYPGKISLVPCFHDEPQFYWATTETLLRNAKHIFFNSADEKQMTIGQYGKTIGRRIVESVVAGVGVELPAGGNDQDAVAMPLPENYFVYAGRKEVGKNVPLLCQWFQAYVERFHRDTKLVFIGGGDKSLVPATDQFLDFGFVSEATKQQVIRGSKGVINLSENESFSIVIMEGWLFGVPAVVSAGCAVTKNHVRKCNGGLFVAGSEEFALALKYLEEHRTVRDLLARNGQQYLAREFSFDAVLTKYLREFRRYEAVAQVANLRSVEGRKLTTCATIRPALHIPE